MTEPNKNVVFNNEHILTIVAVEMVGGYNLVQVVAQGTQQYYGTINSITFTTKRENAKHLLCGDRIAIKIIKEEDDGPPNIQ